MLRRRLMMFHSGKSEFVKPEGTIKLPHGEDDCTEVYPVLDGVKVGVWQGTFYSNWMNLYLYDSGGNLLESRSWQSLTTLTPDECVYFKAKRSRSAGIIKATWL